MNKRRQCRGCGAFLQSDDSTGVGYLPEHLLLEPGKALVCQRCFRIKNYGKNIIHEGVASAEEVVLKGLNWAEGIVLVLDLMDFEASIPKNVHKFSKGKKLVVALNKVDLLPPRTTSQEAGIWAKQRLASLNIGGEIIPVSSTTGFGISRLLEVLEQSQATRWMVVGVTSVGKSSLIGKILEKQDSNHDHAPTVAEFPGTTIESTRWKLKHGIVLSDSPGIIPQRRLVDKMCLDCAIKLIPSQKLHVGVHQLTKNNALVIPGLAALKPENPGSNLVVIGFTAGKLRWQRANFNKLIHWLDQGCGECKVDKWERIKVKLKPNHDLVISGLGWVSVRNQSLECELIIPHDVDYVVRPNLVGEKSEIG